jgi:hypothetical protein
MREEDEQRHKHDKLPPGDECLCLDRVRITRGLSAQLALRASLTSLRLLHCSFNAAKLRLPAALSDLALTGPRFAGLPVLPTSLTALDLSVSQVSKLELELSSPLRSSPLPDLRSLCLRDCPRITSSVVDVLATSCPVLERLDLRGTRVRHVLDVSALPRLVWLGVELSVTVTVPACSETFEIFPERPHA